MAEIRCPMTGEEILDMYFLENRARILEIASFLDRIDRSRDSLIAKDDYRYRGVIQALELLRGTQRRKTELVQVNFSNRPPKAADSTEGPKVPGAPDRIGHDDH